MAGFMAERGKMKFVIGLKWCEDHTVFIA